MAETTLAEDNKADLTSPKHWHAYARGAKANGGIPDVYEQAVGLV